MQHSEPIKVDNPNCIRLFAFQFPDFLSGVFQGGLCAVGFYHVTLILVKEALTIHFQDMTRTVSIVCEHNLKVFMQRDVLSARGLEGIDVSRQQKNCSVIQ